MMKLFSRKVGIALCAATALVFACITGCEASVKIGDDNDNGNGNASIDYKDAANGTLTIRNLTNKDMVLFEGETPKSDTILGGVRAGSSRVFDVSGKGDFQAGGWMLIKGISASEYEANKNKLSSAKIEYSAMATYRSGEYYEATINAAYTGDYCIKVSNNGKIGIELHKDSFNGEKIAYLPAYKSNQYIYFESNKSIRLYPVYVYYSNTKHTVSTLNGDFFESITATPTSVTASAVEAWAFPKDENTTWAQIAGSVTFPTAYITVTNNVAEGAYFKIGTAQYTAQNGQDSIGGIPVTFEIEASTDGIEKQITLALYNGKVNVPVLTSDGEFPAIKNGYDYTVSLKQVVPGTANAIISDPNSYAATISDGTARDISSEIEAL